jgi:hypothetical protein
MDLDVATVLNVEDSFQGFGNVQTPDDRAGRQLID